MAGELRGKLPQFEDTYDGHKMRVLVNRLERAFSRIETVEITEITITADDSPFTLTNKHNNHFIICDDDDDPIVVVLPTGLKNLKYVEFKRDGSDEVTIEAASGVIVDGIDGNNYRLPVGSGTGRKTVLTGRNAQDTYDTDGDSYPV